MSKGIKQTIDSRLANISMSHDLERKIWSGISPKGKKKKRSFAVAAAACLCVFLSIPVLAATIPSFNALIALVSPEIAQFLQPIEIVSESNGIRMEVVAAMNDDETAVVYLTMQDLTGNRFDKNIDLYNYHITGTNMFTHEVVGYDDATRTATIRLLANGGNNLNKKKISVQIDSLLSGEQSHQIFNTGIDLTNITSGGKTLQLNMHNIPGGGGDLFAVLAEKGIVDILKTDEMNISLPNIDFAYITNIGIVDGMLHVQTRWPLTEVYKENIADRGTFYLVSDSGAKVYPTNIYFGVDKDGNTGYGREYVEFIFDATHTALADYSLMGEHFATYSNYIEGKWQTAFRIDAVKESRIKYVDCNIGRTKINSITISPIGITISGTGEESEKLILSIIMCDGSSQEYSRISSNDNGVINVKYIPSMPLDTDNIKSISINGRTIMSQVNSGDNASDESPVAINAPVTNDVVLSTYITDDGLSRVALLENNRFFVEGRPEINYNPTGSYEIDGNKLCLNISENQQFIFSINGNSLIFESGEWLENWIPKETVFTLLEDGQKGVPLHENP